MPYVVVIVRKFNVKANGRVFNRALCRRLELHVPPAPGLCLKFRDGSGKAKIDTVTDEPEAPGPPAAWCRRRSKPAATRSRRSG